MKFLFPTIHGQARTKEYAIWATMKQRCENPKASNFHRYGGRGITICESWRSSFSAFISDVGPRPSRAHTLDRIDNNGNYEKSNCRWATRREQARNRSDCVRYEFRGKSMLLQDWAAELGINENTLWARLKLLKWPVGKAFTEPVDAR